MRKVYDWQAIQRYHNEGHGFVDCQRRFGSNFGAANDNSRIADGDTIGQ